MHNTRNKIREMEALNDLIQIHADKIEIYEKCRQYCAGCYLAEFVEDLVQQGHYFIWLMSSYLRKTNAGEPDFVNRSVYRAWHELRALYAVHKTTGLLAAFEYNEDATIRAYEIVLADLAPDHELKQILHHQKQILIDNQRHIRRMQDPPGQYAYP
ncbi:DUF2383 domain-containing protein [Niabella sp. CC-SYL272]|uniref:DUF2383 domain-containing protein n=1 Tax=Niabella agricola TaxID=2891571 RepID=UPI001F3CE0F8|nr:DUF2383 domain-containing protein [Niabella agricola]MCF3108347.1 DUF2383 domain-containing protein [Niabella agricola]